MSGEDQVRARRKAGSSARRAELGVQEVASQVLTELPVLAGAMQQMLLAEIPEAGEDAEVAGLTLGSCSSNLEAILSMVRHGIPATAAEAPVTALEHARAMAVRGHSVAVMLRFYRLGHGWFIDHLVSRVGSWSNDLDAALTIVGEYERFSFTYIDRISSQVAVEYEAELERLRRRTQAVRMDVVRALVAGEPVDQARAEMQLSHRLLERQVAFVCWSEDSEVDLQAVGAFVAARIGDHEPLLVADETRTVWGWVPCDESSELDALRVELPFPAHVAVGYSCSGPEAFRRSHLEALRVRRIVELAGWRPPTVTGFAEVALVDALSCDLDAARWLVERQLGGLAVANERTAAERASLLAVLDADGSLVAAAHRLGLHRNTVLGRVRRAEERRGRAYVIERAELHGALRLADTLGALVLPRP